MSQIKGAPDTHRIITPSCRKRPAEDVKREVMEDVEDSLDALLDAYDETHRVCIHVAVTVERQP